MKKRKKKLPFKKMETGFHRYAVVELANWFDGKIEEPLYIDDTILLVPDVTASDNRFFEVTYKHELTGRKLGLYQYWSYRNNIPISVYEIDAKYILSHIEKPIALTGVDCYIFEPDKNE